MKIVKNICQNKITDGTKHGVVLGIQFTCYIKMNLPSQ